MIKKGTWIEVMEVVLDPEDRSNSIPEETKNTPLKLWVKGFALEDCDLGEEVEIETVLGRRFKGVVTEENPRFIHDFGDFVPEIMYIGKQAKNILNQEQNL